jgi:hypothetical protein
MFVLCFRVIARSEATWRSTQIATPFGLAMTGFKGSGSQ